MVQTDLLAWKALFDSTGGFNWTYCSDSRENPCSCDVSLDQRVKCRVNGEISEIVLRNNNLQCDTLPVHKIRVFQDLRKFMLDNKGVTNQNQFHEYDSGRQCIHLPECESEWVCAVGTGEFCHNVVSTSVPSASPTTQLTLNEADMKFWQALYDETNGPHWKTKCSREDPCTCVSIDQNKRVECAKGYIVDIMLADNNMTGTLPVALLSTLPYLERVVLAGNVFENSACANLPKCTDTFEWGCDFFETGIRFCVDEFEVSTSRPTGSPTNSPSYLPTSSPIAVDIETNSPTNLPTVLPTNTPTTSVKFGLARFASATFNRSKHDTNAFKIDIANRISKLLPGNPSCTILDVREGSVIVEFSVRASVHLIENMQLEDESLGRADIFILDKETTNIPTSSPTVLPPQAGTGNNNLTVPQLVGISLSIGFVVLGSIFIVIWYFKKIRRQAMGDMSGKSLTCSMSGHDDHNMDKYDEENEDDEDVKKTSDQVQLAIPLPSNSFDHIARENHFPPAV